MGKRIKLSNGRRLVDDVTHIANTVPSAGLWSDFDVARTAQLRRKTRPKIAWNVLFMKAYSLVCMRNPELRRSFVTFPWRQLYEHDSNICMMTMAREHEGEERLFFARFCNPESRSLADLQAQYDHFRRTPIEEIKQFRHQIRFARAPRFVRRFIWWAVFNLWPSKRATHMGTFGISISGHKGAYGGKHVSPSTTTIGVDPFPRNGITRFLLTFDHRVIDGTPATKAIQQVHQCLVNEVTDELAAMVGAEPSTGQPPANHLQIGEAPAAQIRASA